MEDFGGPLVFRESANSESQCLLGIANFGFVAKQRTHTLNVFTNVAAYADFITRSINSLCNPPGCEIMKK